MYSGIKTAVLFLLLAWVVSPCRSNAAVYWPGMSGTGTNALRQFNFAELPGIRQQPLTTEKVNINGQPMVLKIYQLQTTRDVLYNTLRTRFKVDKLEHGSDFLRVVIQKNGRANYERWLFVFAGAQHPVTGFRLEQNGKILRPAQWPQDLPPLPGNARANMVMELPRLNAVYGSFDQNIGTPEQQLTSYSARLASAGWQYAGAEHSPAIRGSGEIYFKNQPVRQMLWIKFGSNGCGAFYLKQIK